MLNWNVSLVVPSFLVLLIIMGYYFALPRLPVRLNKTYLAILINEGVVMLFDIISSWADNMHDILPVWLLVILNSVYFFSLALRIFLFFELTTIVLRVNIWKNKVAAILLCIPYVAEQIIIITGMFTGNIFYINENGYNRGPLHFTIYVCLYFYLFTSFFMIYKFRMRIRRKHERVSILCFNTIILIGSIFRITLPTLLLYDTFCLMALIVIYLSFGNPEFYLERRNMAFNSKALRSYIEENEEHGKYKILAFVIRDYHDVREIYGTTQMDQGIALISAYLRVNYPDCLDFYNQGGRFILLGGVNMDWEEIHEELRHRFMLPWTSDDAELYLEAGFALIDCTEGYFSADEVLNMISIMLEKADVLGSDFNILADENVLSEFQDRIEVKRCMENAIDRKAVEVFFQPLVSAKTRKLVGAEALARIRDNDGHIIPPAAFIPLAEKNGRINQLGEQVFEKVCQFISENDANIMGLTFINVNLSPIQFMRSDLGKGFLSTLNMYGITPDRIHLEITEESMTDEQQMEKQIRLMQNYGFKFVLDDYGKGYSNLTRLKKSPFVNVKLDMEIVWDYCNAPDEILPMMVEAFKKMNFGVTAEGIETEEMAWKMTELGCDYLQGMLFSAPIPAEDFAQKYAKG
ncbi:EAL domain-containing protein [Butyrivibrio sp. AD3002]|uniref:EAL domain-containing protein n=1 Tax=Butyrivibrio sp. AD3002 TaxID=1280670 RepID=UPI0003B40FAD|nr:EAL domain-containing protein [Butyrivibrio sp. AD3002]